MPDRAGHRVDVPGRAGHRLGQHAAVQIERAGGDVARLARGCAECGPYQRLRLLLHHRQQAVPHDLQLDLGDVAACHGVTSSISSSLPAPTRAEKPGGTMVDVPASTMIAGPVSRVPAGSAARGYTAASVMSPLAGSISRTVPMGGGGATSGGAGRRSGSEKGCASARVHVTVSTSSPGITRP